MNEHSVLSETKQISYKQDDVKILKKEPLYKGFFKWYFVGIYQRFSSLNRWNQNVSLYKVTSV